MSYDCSKASIFQLPFTRDWIRKRQVCISCLWNIKEASGWFQRRLLLSSQEQKHKMSPFYFLAGTSFYSQGLVYYLAHSRCSENIWWKKKWMNKYRGQLQVKPWHYLECGCDGRCCRSHLATMKETLRLLDIYGAAEPTSRTCLSPDFSLYKKSKHLWI